jgi:gliding motility-associated lipoprotein GldH
MKKSILVLGFFMILLSGCQQDKSQSQIINFDGSTWQRFKFLNFEFPVEATDDTWDFLVVMRVTEEFPSQAMIFNLVMNMPSGEERIREFKIDIRDKEENMLGEQKAGYYEYILPVRREVRLYESGLLKFEIENLMTKYYTPGVAEFGMVLEPSE